MDNNVADNMNFVGSSLSLGSLSYGPLWKDIGTPWPDLVEGLSTTIFPGDVIVEVLAKLPIKSLVRFLCVCKVWYSVIKDKTFHDKHTNYNKYISLLFEKQKFAEEMAPSASTANMPPSRKHTLPPFPLNSCYTLFQEGTLSDQNVIEPPVDSLAPVIIGVINGIVCFVEYNSCVVLRNQATREFHRVPAPSNFPQNEVCTTFGFSLDTETNDYKIVRVTYGKNVYKTPHVEIYSIKKNVWTVYSQSNPFTWYLYDCKCSAILGGIPYWKADECVAVGMPLFRDFIAGFSPCSDTFIEIKLPKLKRSMTDKWIVGTVGQSLAIGLNRTKVFEVLLLDDNRWSKVFSIRTFEDVNNWVACFSNSVSVAKTSKKFFVYSTCSGEITPHGPCQVFQIYNDIFEYSELSFPQFSFSLFTLNLNQRCS